MKMKHDKTISLFHFSSSSTPCTVHILCFLIFVILPTSTLSAILYSNETDRISLLHFKHQISDDPHGESLNSWNHSEHHCRWQGVSCGRRHGRVVALRLPGKGLVGTISPQIGNLTFLRDIDLSSNGFRGQIPGQIGRLFRLRYLNLSVNALTGDLLFANLSHCLQLRRISIFRNGLHGKLPIDLPDLNQLRLLDLEGNDLSGKIPPSFGNFSSLQALGLRSNHLGGKIPYEISQLSNLLAIGVGSNNLSGTLPSAFFNMTSIRSFIIADNSIQGVFPTNMGDTMPNLIQFSCALNFFHGAIPISFPNASKLTHLDLSGNYFTGKVPHNLGRLGDLVWLNFESNLLGDLAFIPSLSNCSNLQTFSISGNRFEGKLPNTIANLSSKLYFLDIGVNMIYGMIPIGIKNLGNLIALDLSQNLLSGVIPSEIGDLHKLQGLDLGKNKFFGEIPSTLYNLTSLNMLGIDGNNLDGNIPSIVGNFWNLNQLDISHNKFSGSIPEQVFSLQALSVILNLSRNSFTGHLSPAVGKLKTLNSLDISRNKLSGKIPESLGDCFSLEHLDLHANHLEGEIPPSLISLKSIKYLDISNNKLTGEIPREFQNLTLLQYLNLSFNDLVGEVPKTGIFAMATNVSLLGNKKLCGGVPDLKLPPCPVKKRRSRKYIKLMIVIFTCVSVAVVFVLFFAFLKLHHRKHKKESTKLFKDDNISKISYSDLHRATEGFSETNLIGHGSFGYVYKGRFEQGGEQTVAIKVLDLLTNGASKSFLAECKVLRNIRHRNLVQILTCCSSCDFAGNEFKALVYEFMENGDLDMWLHTHSSDARKYVLSVLQRLNIAIDVAFALNYLHDDCDQTVIHCDLKPSNILLDKDLTAHVGDFGLSRLYSSTTKGSSGEHTSTFGLKGTIGYIAPEYGAGANVSTWGDVYSYGIFLLEMFTAKRPTYDFFSDGCSSLREYVEAALPNEVMKIVDPLLLAFQESNHEIRCKETLEINPTCKLVEIEESKMDDDFFISMFKIGLTCSSLSPMDRTPMKDVARELQKIRKTFFV